MEDVGRGTCLEQHRARCALEAVRFPARPPQTETDPCAFRCRGAGRVASTIENSLPAGKGVIFLPLWLGVIPLRSTVKGWSLVLERECRISAASCSWMPVISDQALVVSRPSASDIAAARGTICPAMFLAGVDAALNAGLPASANLPDQVAAVYAAMRAQKLSRDRQISQARAQVARSEA